MEIKFDYTKHPENNRSGYEKIGHSLNENNNNIEWDKLNEKQIILAKKLKSDPTYFPTFSEFQQLLEMAVLTDFMWEQNKKLQVFFKGGTKEWIDKTLEIANIWNEHCNISFHRTMNVNQSHLRIGFENSGCYSYIGNVALTVSNSESTLNLEISNLNLEDVEFKRIVLHEFGHALGLIHEHQSPNANMKWNKFYVYNYFYMRYGWDKSKVDINLFDEYANLSKGHSELDSTSIMGYYIPTEFTENGIVFPLNNDLSQCDIDFIGKIYPKSKVDLIKG
jgi:Astacin (Peptidase family M12A).